MGEAGAMVTDDLEVAERARLLRQFGCDHNKISKISGGISSFMDEIQATILRAKLP